MMIQKRNRLPIVTAFIIGTTMLSSMDTAWGMGDGNDLIGGASSTHLAAPRFFLTETARVNEETRKGAESLLSIFDQRPDMFELTEKGLLFRKTLIISGCVLDHEKKVSFFIRELARVTTDLDSEKPDLPFNSLVIQGLLTISLAVDEDPYDSITRDESKPVIPTAEMDFIRQSLQKAKKDAQLSDFFSANLPNVVASYPTIVPSLIARYPREEDKIALVVRDLITYFGLNNPVEPKKSNVLASKNRPLTLLQIQHQLDEEHKRQESLKRKHQEQFDKELNALAEAFYLLKQRNDRATPPASSAPIELDPLPASSSSPAPADEPILRASPTTFKMGEPNSYKTTGFSAFEGSHRWTIGTEASIILPFEKMESRPSSISFLNTKGLITASHSQKLSVKVNGQVVRSYVYAPGDNNHTIDIPLPKDEPATIEFETPNAISPSELGINPDKRALGISFREVQFQY